MIYNNINLINIKKMINKMIIKKSIYPLKIGKKE